MNLESPGTIAADVLIASDIPPDEAVWLAAEFTSVGLTADLRVAGPKRSFGDITWAILAAIPLQSFFSRLAEDAADDVHQRLKTFVNRLLRRRQTGTGPRPVIVLQDTLSGAQVVLHYDLPADSYRQLLGLDLTGARHGPLHYDQEPRSKLPQSGPS